MPILSKLEIYGIIALVIALAMLGAYFKGHHAGAQSVQEKWDKAIVEQRDREQKQAQTAVTKLETSNEKAKVVYRTITQTVDKIVQTPIYLNRCFDADGLSVANEALTGTLAPVAKPDRPVSRPNTVIRWDSGLSTAEGG